jgi:hypothetical protein
LFAFIFLLNIMIMRTLFCGCFSFLKSDYLKSVLFLFYLNNIW